MWSRLCVAILALAQTQAAPTVQSSDPFSQAVIDQAYHEVAPAIGVLAFTSEITNPATGDITKRDGHALGLIVAPDGLVMTHGHMLLENTQPINIRFTVGQGEDETEYRATLLEKPDDINVCFLRIESDDLPDMPYVTFSRDSTLKLGEPIVVLGLLSKTLDYARGLYTCRVGAILEKPRTTYCLDRHVRFGFVTGPAINVQGQVVGVIGFDLSPSEGGELYVRSGHPLIYQTGLFQHYIDNPPGKNEIADKQEDAWLGVFTQPLTDDFAEYWGLEKEGGVIVSTVVAGSPAEKAGCQSGDIITNFDGVPVRPKQDREITQFTKLVRETGVGKTVLIKLLRDGQPLELEVHLEARPTPAREASEYKDETFGLTVRELTTDVRITLNLPDTVQGVIIRRVKSGSVAQLAGMRPGMIIMNFGDHPVTNLDDLQEAVQKVIADKPNEVSVFCRAGSVTGFFRLEPRWNAREK